MKLSWNPSFSASAMYGAYTIAYGMRLTDRRVEEALHASSFGLHALASGLDGLRRGDSSVADMSANQRRAKRLWHPLIALAGSIQENHQLAKSVITCCLGETKKSTATVDSLAGWITEIEATMRLLFPKLTEQLGLRARPLQELWEGYGHGLLAHVGRLVPSSLLVEQAEVLLVQPVLGGFGQAFPDHQKVCLEAVLANPLPELPEVIRLAWLLGQLRPKNVEPTPRLSIDREIELNRLAMLPAVLAAGQVVELTRIDEAYLSLAIEQWQVPVPPKIAVGKVLLHWWETYLQTKPEWSIGLLALDRMLVG